MQLSVENNWPKAQLAIIRSSIPNNVYKKRPLFADGNSGYTEHVLYYTLYYNAGYTNSNDIVNWKKTKMDFLKYHTFF